VRNSDFSLDRRIEAAFSMNFIKNTAFDMGIKYSMEEFPGTLEERSGFSLGNPLYFAAAAMYSGVPKLRLGIALDGHFLGTLENHRVSNFRTITSAPQIAFNIFPTYDFGSFDLGADITYGIQLGDKKGINDKQILGCGVHAQFGYNTGSFRIGAFANIPMNEGEKLGIIFPVWITYSF